MPVAATSTARRASAIAISPKPVNVRASQTGVQFDGIRCSGNVMKKALLASLVAVLAGTSYGQSLSFRCKFSDGQVTDFDRGSPRTKRTNDLSDLIFDQVDPSKNTARFIGNLGAETVRAIHGDDFVHLIEITNGGSMNLTTIFYRQALRSGGQVPVVHSRHVNTGAGPLPSQYIGLCTKLL